MRANSATLFPLSLSNTPCGTYRYSQTDFAVDAALHHAIAARAFRGTSRSSRPLVSTRKLFPTLVRMKKSGV